MSRIRRGTIAGLAAAIVVLLAGASVVVVGRSPEATPEVRRLASAVSGPTGTLRDGATTQEAGAAARAGTRTGDTDGDAEAANGPQTLADLEWPSASNPDPNFPLTVRVSSPCGTPAQAMRASVQTLPKTWIAMMVVYSDGNPRETWYTGQVGPDGSFSLSWIVPPDAPEGPGRVAVTATHDDQDDAASATVGFRVERIGGCA